MGIIRADYDAVKIARIYEACGARAISVLTDRNFFQGSLEDLQRVAASVNLPVIRKDFILHEKQIREAVRFGASAILLIVRKEAEIAVEVGSRIIGINTRDLDTFQIHQNLIEEVSLDLPKHIHIVGESGIKNRNDYQNMKKYVQSTLIGTYFMQKEDITSAYKELVS